MRLVIPDTAEVHRTTIQFGREFTDAELREFSGLNPGFVTERVGKESVTMSPSGGESSRRSVRLMRQLDDWASAREDGEVYGSEAGFRLADGSVLAPDAAWVSSARLAGVPAELLSDFLPVAPDLVIEVLSPSDRLADARRKCERWIDSGVRAAMLVDAEQRRTEVFLAGSPAVVTDAIHIAIPGFADLAFDMADVWRGPRR
jgi:Uma2 family endonuclease